MFHGITSFYKKQLQTFLDNLLLQWGEKGPNKLNSSNLNLWILLVLFLPMNNGAYSIHLKLVIGQNFKVSHSVIAVYHHHCLLFIVLIQVGGISWPSKPWSGVPTTCQLTSSASNNISVQTPPTFNSVHAGTAVHSLPRSLTAHLQLADWQV